MASFNPTHPSYTDDPYPALARLRAEEPVHFSVELNAWIVTRYADCSTVLHDAVTYRSDFLAIEGARWDEARARSQLFLEGVPALSAMADPDHHRMRDTVSGVFAPRVVQRLRPRIEAAVNRLLDQVQRGKPFDVMGGLAYPLPRLVIAEQLGIAEEDRGAFQLNVSLIARAMFGTGTPDEERRAHEARESLLGYLARLNARGVGYDAGGALARMFDAHGAHGAQALSDAELMALTVDVALAGNDPTACLIGNGILALLTHPDQLARLRERPELVPDAVEELLRYDSPLHALMRITAADVTLGGKQLQQGDVVYLLLGAANRDPEQFRDPDRLDIGRENRRHLSFGAGAHHCLGAPLARLEATTAFSTLIARFPGLRLAPLGVEREAEFELRGPSRLMVIAD